MDFSTSGYKVFLVNGTTEIDITGDVVGTPINVNPYIYNLIHILIIII